MSPPPSTPVASVLSGMSSVLSVPRLPLPFQLSGESDCFWAWGKGDSEGGHLFDVFVSFE